MGSQVREEGDALLNLDIHISSGYISGSILLITLCCYGDNSGVWLLEWIHMEHYFDARNINGTVNTKLSIMNISTF